MKDISETPTNPSEIPTVDHIENLLRSINPQPSQEFHQKMHKQPWNRYTRNPLTSWFFSRMPQTIVVAFIILLFAISLATPSLGVVANRIARFFTISPTDQVLIEIPLDSLESNKDSFNKTIQEVSDMAGFILSTPGYLPSTFTFRGAGFNPDREVVTLSYESMDGSIIRISQRRSGVEYQSISVNASIDRVKIGPYDGEYVRGGWVIDNYERQNPLTTSSVTLEAIWDSEDNIQFLRWESQDILFEIVYLGSQDITPVMLGKNDLIRIGESLK